MLDELCCHDTPCADSSHHILINDVYECFTSYLRNASLCACKMIKTSVSKTKLIWPRNLCILKANRKVLYRWRNHRRHLYGDLYTAKQSTKHEYKRA